LQARSFSVLVPGHSLPQRGQDQCGNLLLALYKLKSLRVEVRNQANMSRSFNFLERLGIKGCGSEANVL
jgi:hypothetical protein